MKHWNNDTDVPFSRGPLCPYLYDGIVHENRDPLSMGRIRVTIPGLIEPYSTWALPIGMPGAGEGRGFWSVPQVGENVAVMFKEGDPNSPRYLAGPWGAPFNKYKPRKPPKPPPDFTLQWSEEIVPVGAPAGFKVTELPVVEIFGVDQTGQVEFPSDSPVGRAIVPPNFDFVHRPIVHNTDGTVSTTLSASFDLGDGFETLIPTIDHGGNKLTNEQAIDLFRDSGEHLGIYKTVTDADAAAAYIHEYQVRFPIEEMSVDPSSDANTSVQPAGIRQFSGASTTTGGALHLFPGDSPRITTRNDGSRVWTQIVEPRFPYGVRPIGASYYFLEEPRFDGNGFQYRLLSASDASGQKLSEAEAFSQFRDDDVHLGVYPTKAEGETAWAHFTAFQKQHPVVLANSSAPDPPLGPDPQFAPYVPPPDTGPGPDTLFTPGLVQGLGPFESTQVHGFETQFWRVRIDDTQLSQTFQIQSLFQDGLVMTFNGQEETLTIEGRVAVVIKSLGVVKIDALQVIINGRVVLPSGDPI